jgi:transposase
MEPGFAWMLPSRSGVQARVACAEVDGMIQVAAGTKVYLACRPVSMRYGFDDLAAQVGPVLAADPFSGHVFIFRSKRADYLKIVYYEGTGLCLFAKRLERGKFVGPRSSMAGCS